MKAKIKTRYLIYGLMAGGMLAFCTIPNNFTYDTYAIKEASEIKKDWIKGSGGTGFEQYYSAIETRDGGFVGVGYTDSIDGDLDGLRTDDWARDAIIVKYNANGEKEWLKVFGENRVDDFFKDVVETSDGGFMVFGESSSSNAGFVNNGLNDGIVVKYDINGNQEWVENFGGSKRDVYSSATKINDGGYIAVGDSYSSDGGFLSRGKLDGIISKYDDNGNMLWVKNFGGSGEDVLNSVTATKDGGFVVVGYSDSADAGFNNKGLYDAVILKFDANGNQEWVKNFGDSAKNEYISIKKTKDGGFVAVGKSYLAPGSYDTKAIITKYDANGNQQWTNSFDGDAWSLYYSVEETSNGDLIAIGGEFWVKYDANGNQEWVKYPSKMSFNSIIRTSDNKFIAVGFGDLEDASLPYNDRDAVIGKFLESFPIKDSVEKAEETKNLDSIEDARDKVNRLPESAEKEELQNRLDAIPLNIPMEKKFVTSNLDLYIKSENILGMSLDTNSIKFEEFSGIEDIEKVNAVNLTINSSLPYEINSYLVSEIQNADKSNTMDKQILNIKANSESTYKTFSSINTKVNLLDNQIPGNNKVHSIDLKLKGGIAHDKDNYKTAIKFEAQQK